MIAEITVDAEQETHNMSSTLHARMLAEIEARESAIFGRLEVGAWSRRI